MDAVQLPRRLVEDENYMRSFVVIRHQQIRECV
jgi:hypothetical protein